MRRVRLAGPTGWLIVFGLVVAVGLVFGAYGQRAPSPEPADDALGAPVDAVRDREGWRILPIGGDLSGGDAPIERRPVVKAAEQGGAYLVYERELVPRSTIVVSLARAETSGVVPIGDVSATFGSSLAIDPDVAVSPDGTVFVAWSDLTPRGFEVRVVRLEAGVFQDVTPNPTVRARRPSIAVDDEGGGAWLAFETPDTGAIRALRSTSEGWEPAGRVSPARGVLAHTSPLVLAGGRGVFLLWTAETGGGAELRAALWSGTAWIEMPNELTGVATAEPRPFASAAISPSGDLLVASVRADGEGARPQVLALSDEGWSVIGDSINPAPHVSVPNLEVAGDGSLYLAWQTTLDPAWEQAGGPLELRLVSLQGGKWLPIGLPLAAREGEASHEHPSLAVVDGGGTRLLLAWHEVTTAGSRVRLAERLIGDG